MESKKQHYGIDPDRFWSGVQCRAYNECWPWLRSTHDKGYGRIRENKHGRLVPAHRVAFQLSGRQLHADKMICHSCDNPPCCNPAHLFEGDARINYDDAWRKHRVILPPVKFGEDNPATKLAREDILKIRDLYEIGNWTYTALGHRFNVNRRTVSRIIHKQRRSKD